MSDPADECGEQRLVQIPPARFAKRYKGKCMVDTDDSMEKTNGDRGHQKDVERDLIHESLLGKGADDSAQNEFGVNGPEAPAIGAPWGCRRAAIP